MVRADIRLSPPPASDPARHDARGDVIADRVMTDSGVEVGSVTDVVIDTAIGAVVGYEVLPADEPEQRKGRRSYLPLPETGAVSGEALIVPSSAVDYISTDLAGFGRSHRPVPRPAARYVMNLSDLTGHPGDLTSPPPRPLAGSPTSSSTPRPGASSGTTFAHVKGRAVWLSWDAVDALGAAYELTIDRRDVLTEPPEHGRGLRADKVIGGHVAHRLRSGNYPTSSTLRSTPTAGRSQPSTSAITRCPPTRWSA